MVDDRSRLQSLAASEGPSGRSVAGRRKTAFFNTPKRPAGNPAPSISAVISRKEDVNPVHFLRGTADFNKFLPSPRSLVLYWFGTVTIVCEQLLNPASPPPQDSLPIRHMHRACGVAIRHVALPFGPTRRVLNWCRLSRTATAVLSARTTTPDMTSCSLVFPSSNTGQSMDALSVCPVMGGLSAVKLSPELLRSTVRPVPVFTGTRWSDTV
jgi:hypothetical protein